MGIAKHIKEHIQLGIPWKSVDLARMCCIGDSFISQGTATGAPSAITSSGTTMTITQAGHGQWQGSRLALERVDQDEYNGLHEVDTVLSANQYTVQFAGSSTPIATSSAGFSVSPQERLTDKCIAAWANFSFTGGPRFVIDTIAGAGGQRSDQVLARLDRDCLSRDPDLVLEYSGINDIIQGYTASQIYANRSAMWDRIIAAGRTPIVTTLAPLHYSYVSFTAERAAQIIALNTMIRDYAHRNKRALLLDVFKIVTDPTSNYTDIAAGTFTTSFAWKTGYTTDFIHPTPEGYAQIGLGLRDLLSPILPTMELLPSSVGDSYQYNSASRQLLDNPLMVNGAGGTVAGNVVPGAANVAHLWQITASGAGSSVSASVVARGDGIGYNQRAELTSTASADYMELHQPSSIHARVAAGDQIMFVCELDLTNMAAIDRHTALIEFTLDGTAYNCGFIQSGSAVGQTNKSLIIATPVMTVPAGTLTNLRTRVRVRASGAGGAQMDVGRCGLLKLN